MVIQCGHYSQDKEQCFREINCQEQIRGGNAKQYSSFFPVFLI